MTNVLDRNASRKFISAGSHVPVHPPREHREEPGGIVPGAPLPRGLAFPLVFSAMTTVAASPCSFLTPLIFVGRPKITACRIDTCAHDRTTRVCARSGANRGDKASERLDSRPENHPSLLARSTLSDNPRAASSLPVACTRCVVAWRNLVVLLPRRMPIEFGGGGDQC